MFKPFVTSLIGIFLAGAALAEAPVVALVIDDLGYSWNTDKRAVDLPGPVAVSILPNTPYAVRLAGYAKQQGVTVMLHLPMAPLRNPGTEGIQLDTTEAQFKSYVRSSLQAVPHVQGLNNHQGSLLTQHPGHMAWLMQEMKQQTGLFFVDSYTTPQSVALTIAREHRVPAMRRHVFLDGDEEKTNIEEQFERLKQLSRKQGVALAIAHPHDATLTFLENRLPSLDAEGIELVDVVTAIHLSEQKIHPSGFQTGTTSGLGR